MIHSPTVVSIHWAMLKVLITFQGKQTYLEYNFLGIRFCPKPKIDKKTKTPVKKKAKSHKKSVQGSRFKKITLDFIKEVIYHPLIKQVLNKTIRLLKRLLRAIDFKKFDVDIGLKDYYWQGIIHGLSYLIQYQSINIRSNYQEQNRIELDLYISIWRVLGALLAFLITFPYLKTFRFYKHTLLKNP